LPGLRYAAPGLGPQFKMTLANAPLYSENFNVGTLEALLRSYFPGLKKTEETLARRFWAVNDKRELP
jgi:hypothetical protein